MQSRVPSSCLLLALVLGASCSGEPAAPTPPAPPPRATSLPANARRLPAPDTDVAMLQLQPDGTYRRVCRAPGPEVRAMLDGLARSRRVPR